MKAFIFLFALFSFGAFAVETDRVLENDNLEKIARRNLSHAGPFDEKYLKTFANDLKKWNPSITNWDHPPKNKLIYVSYPYSPYLSGSTWSEKLDSGESEFLSLENWHGSFFGATSFGRYTQSSEENNIHSTQNLPLLGATLSATNLEQEHFLAAGFYYGKPPVGRDELGGNLYYEYSASSAPLGFYVGYDFESINTYNSSEIEMSGNISTVSNQLHYATLGMTKKFEIFSLGFNFESAISHLINGKNDRSENVTGNKWSAKLTYKPRGIFSFGAFYNHHELKSSSQSSIDRIGFSIGVMVF